MSSIYERITKLCNEKDITGYRLAKDLGLSPGFITDLKSGRLKGMSAVKANKVANYFGVTVDYLLNGEEKTPDTDSVERKEDEQLKLADSLFESLSEEDRTLALAFLKKLAQSQ